MEESITGFTQEYRKYDNYRNRFQFLLDLNHQGYTNAEKKKIKGEFDNLDVKLRLAFGIKEIILNPLFVNEKQGALKECHLLYYKMADLWFAYETFFKFLIAVKKNGPRKINNIMWLDEPGYIDFNALPYIMQHERTINNNLRAEFGSAQRHTELTTYLQYCEDAAKGTQKTRLGDIKMHLFSPNYNLDHTKIFTLIYSIRNNFAHGGETTVVPNNFSFENKGRLLRILYPYLTMVVISVTNKAISEI